MCTNVNLKDKSGTLEGADNSKARAYGSINFCTSETYHQC